MGVQSFGRTDVLLVCSDEEWLLNYIQPVPPLFEGKRNSQQLLVANVIVSLSRRQVPGEKGKTAPTPTFEASATTTNWHVGSSI